MSAESSPAGPAGDAAAAGREPSAAGIAAAQFRRLTEDYLDDLAHRHPDIATELGDHRYDHRLPERGAAALDDERRGLDQFAARLAALDHAGLDKELLVDAAVLGNDVARRLFEITELREHEWNPLLANPGQAIYMLLARDYAPLADRLRAAGLTDVTVRTYPEGRHEILNETNSAEVIGELVRWLDRALPS